MKQDQVIPQLRLVVAQEKLRIALRTLNVLIRASEENANCPDNVQLMTVTAEALGVLIELENTASSLNG